MAIFPVDSCRDQTERRLKLFKIHYHSDEHYPQWQALTIALQLSYRGAHGMGICPGQAPMTTSPFCPFRVKTVPSEEDCPSCGVLVDLVQPLITIGSVNYAFLSKLPLR